MKRILVVALLSTVVIAVLPAQGRAVMESPVIRGTPEEVRVIVRFKDFAAGADYRLGIGAAGGLDFSKVRIELQKDGVPTQMATADFEQGYTNSWWSVPKISARGFLFGESNPPGGEILLTVWVPRSQAEAAGKFFVFVAKNYGSETWYLEDGAELNKSHW